MSGHKQHEFNEKNSYWILDNDNNLDTTTWLKYEVINGDLEHMLTLRCAVCIQFKITND